MIDPNQIQKSVIRSAAKMLKAGGRLVYATCSILQEKEENQEDAFINDFLAENPDFRLLNSYEILGKQGIEISPYQAQRFGDFFSDACLSSTVPTDSSVLCSKK